MQFAVVITCIGVNKFHSTISSFANKRTQMDLYFTILLCGYNLHTKFLLTKQAYLREFNYKNFVSMTAFKAAGKNKKNKLHI